MKTRDAYSSLAKAKFRLRKEPKLSTCIRNGATYKRHWWGEDGVCRVCGHVSEWKIQQLEAASQAKQNEQVTPEKEHQVYPDDLTPI